MTWIGDGVSTFHSEGATLLCTCEGLGDVKCNFMWKDGEGVSEGTHYWEISLDEGSDAFLGMTSPSKFKKGYGLRGLLFGGPGNLSNGIGLLKGNWGPQFCTGDRVGILVDAHPDQLDVSFFINGIYIGKAFSLAAPYIKPLFPVISFGSGKQKVTIRKQDQAPAAVVHETPKERGIEGNWELSNLYDPNNIVKLSISKEDTIAYKFFAKCANSIWTVASLDSSGQWMPGPCASTMMFSQRWVNTEKHISNLLSKIHSVEVKDDCLLIASSDGDERFFLRARACMPKAITEVDLD